MKFRKFEILFSLFLFITYKFLPAEIIWAVALLYIIFVYLTKPIKVLNSSMGIGIGVWIIYISFSLFNISQSPKLNDILRDIFLLSSVPIFFFFGSLLQSLNKRNLSNYHLILLLSFYSVIFHLYNIFNASISFVSIDDFRFELGRSSLIEVFGFCLMLIIILRRPIFGQDFKNIYLYIAIFFLTISIVFYFSRTMYISIIVMTLFSFGILKINLKSVLIFFSLLLIFYNIIEEVNSFNFKNELLTKFTKIYSELFSYKVHQFDFRDINTKWRSYETFKALELFSNSSWIEKFLGHGLGYRLRLDTSIQLGQFEYQSIPTFHNGFIYVLLKFGVLGLFLFILFIQKLINNKKLKNNINTHRFFLGMTIAILFATISSGGFFNPAFSLSIITLGSQFGQRNLSKTYV
ncbi:O-antigen ligase family protein [Lacihabitans lacunae]|uniref:O-antigen ligase family protein n=1 Tax=Lacihabitans lacunae TaxID=1028214 RepID=A0ABV7YTS5_9BACT